MITRRDVLVALVGAGLTLASVTALDARREVLGSAIFDWNSFTATPNKTGAVRKVVTDGTTDLARIVYGADLTLHNLTPGRYLLQVTVSDRIAKTVATQQAAFVIE